MSRCPASSLGHRTALAVLLASLFLYAGCEPPPGEERLPRENSLPFSVVVTEPSAGSIEVPRNGDLVLRFSDFPDPESLVFPSLSLGPRGDPARVNTQVSLVDRQVRLRPVVPLPAKTEIVLTLSRSVQSLAGRPLATEFQLVFRTAETLAPLAPSPPTPTLAQLLGSGGALANRCAQAACHSRVDGASMARHEPAAGLDFSLAPDALRGLLLSGRRGGTEGLLWVEPGRPERSYLLRKLLAAQPQSFTRIIGSPMPLSGAALLPDALRTIESWIRSGAQ